MSLKNAPFSEFVQKAVEIMTKARENPEYKPSPLDGELTEDYPGQVSEQLRIKKAMGLVNHD